MSAYRLIAHTADVGLLVEGPDPATLFAEAALALTDQVVDRKTVRAAQERSLSVDGADWTDLMVNWLREVLYLFNGEQWLVTRVRIQTIAATGLTARLHGETFDPRRHPVSAEIKAVTYHQAEVRTDSGHWQARVILDL